MQQHFCADPLQLGRADLVLPSGTMPPLAGFPDSQRSARRRPKSLLQETDVTFTETELVLAIIIVIVAGIALWVLARRRKSAALKDRFGPEYERTVQEIGDERKAETVLAERQKRVAGYTIKPLPTDMRDHFVESWRQVQAQFVDDPTYAVARADDLLSEVMRARGYPMADFEHRAEDLSVDHPDIVENYRRGHEIAVRHSKGEASTEDLRTAMIRYRTLFDDLVNKPDAKSGTKTFAKERPHG